MYDIVEDVNKYLKEIKIVDPAVGSGAFPMGILLEIVSLCEYIEKEFLNNINISSYELKKETIQNSIYGVDIDPGAVEIAKLRFWLSLVVDAKEPEPLPNLDYKIMQGNSLIETFVGVNVSNISNKGKIENVAFCKEHELAQQLHEKQKSHYRSSDREERELLRDEIESIIIEIYHTKIEKEKEGYTSAYKSMTTKANSLPNDKLRKEYIEKEESVLIKKFNFDFSAADKILHDFSKKDKIRPFFPWHLYFADVFEKGGFDIIITNPPYLKERDNAAVFSPVNKSELGKKYHCGKMDYWFYFLHKAVGIAKCNSIITFITSRYWLNSSGAKKIIQHAEEELSFVDVIDIGKLKVFDNVFGHHMIGQYVKNKTQESFKYKKLENCLDDINCEDNTNNILITNLKNSDVFIDNEILFNTQDFKLDNCTLLYDVCKVAQGVVEAPDKLSKKMLKEIKNTKFQIGDGVFVLSEKEFTSLSLTKEEQLVTEKYLDPNDVMKYEINYNKKYLIYSNNDIMKKIETNGSFYQLKNHLNKYHRFITSSNAPYGLHRPREKRIFESPKIIFKNMFEINEFCYDEENYYYGFSFSSIIQKNNKYDLKYILAILNSKFALYWFYIYGKQRGVGVDIGVKKLRKFPIKINEDNQQPFIKLVDQIIIDKKAGKDTQKLEDKIDLMVYKLYELSYEEVKIIDPEVDKVLESFGFGKEEFERMGVEGLSKLN